MIVAGSIRYAPYPTLTASRSYPRLYIPLQQDGKLRVIETNISKNQKPY
jgi:hypothetical protein